MKIIKEIPFNNHIMGTQLYNKYKKVINPATINLNIKCQVLRDKGSLFIIKSLKVNGVGKILGLKP